MVPIKACNRYKVPVDGLPIMFQSQSSYGCKEVIKPIIMYLKALSEISLDSLIAVSFIILRDTFLTEYRLRDL